MKKPRPEWMETGRLHPETGVPMKLGNGRFITSRDRLRYATKMGDRKNRNEWLQQYWKQHTLSPWQKKAGARLIV